MHELKPSLWTSSSLCHRRSVAGQGAAVHLPLSGARSALLLASMLRLALGLSGASAPKSGPPSLKTALTTQGSGLHVTRGTTQLILQSP